MGKQLEKISVSAGEDLLAFIPHMVGYWPENSIVCIGMHGKRLRATMRLDLPPLETSEQGSCAGPSSLASSASVAGLAQLAADQLASDTNADGCLLAVFGQSEWVQAEELPYAVLYRQFRAAFAARGLPIKDAWYVGPGHWRSMECADDRCCPWPGKDIASIKESYVNTEFIFRGSMVGESPADQIQKLIALGDPHFVETVTAAGAEFKQPLELRGLTPQQLGVTLAVWDHALLDWPKTPDPVIVAYLLASLRAVSTRDTVLVALATSREISLAGAAGLGLMSSEPWPDSWRFPWLDLSPAEDEDEGADVVVPRIAGYDPLRSAIDFQNRLESLSEEELLGAAHEFGKVLVGEIAGGGDPALIAGPDWARLDGAEPLLQFLAASTGGRDKAPVLCMLGWIQWCKGRGSWAGHYFEACQTYQPGYRLAVLLDQLLAVGYIAECAKNPQTAWHGYGVDG